MQEQPLIYRHLSVSVRYKAPLFPFDEYPFIEMIKKHGFLLADKIEQPPLGTKLSVKGTVARKGDVLLSMESDRQILAIHAPEPKKALEEFRDLERLLEKELGFSGSRYVYFYELLASLSLKAKRNPLEIWSSYSSQSPKVEKFSKVLGKSASHFGIRLSPQDLEPNQQNWFDIKIRPDLPEATRQHYVEIVYRNGTWDEVANFTKDLDQRINQLVEIVEEQ